MATAGVTSSATSGAASNRDISSQLNTAVGDHLQSVKSMLKESGCWPVGVCVPAHMSSSHGCRLWECNGPMGPLRP